MNKILPYDKLKSVKFGDHIFFDAETMEARLAPVLNL